MAGQLKADHIRGEDVHRLAQHGRFGLDATHAPADHADAVDHGGVAVGADQRVGVADAVFGLVDAGGQVLQIHLVDDAKARRHHAKGVKGLHAPFHELVALVVALKFELHVLLQRLRGAVVVHHDRVIDHQIDRHQRLNRLGRFAQLLGRSPHGGQIHQQRHAGEVLQHDAGDDKGDFLGALGLGLPVGQLGNVLGQHLGPVTVAQHGFKHDAQRHRQPRHVGKLFGQLGQGIQLALATLAQGQRLEGGSKCVGSVGHGRNPFCGALKRNGPGHCAPCYP